MKHTVRKAATALLAAVACGMPLAAPGQIAETGSRQIVLLRYALAHFDSETQTLATMRNHIPSREIVPVAVTGLDTGAADRRALMRMSRGSRHAALVAALGKATVADEDRQNGQSEDQSSLAEYLQHLRIDPNSVVAVDIDPRRDRENPRVTVFYRR